MKPVEYAISDASFTRHYYKLLLVRLQKFKNLKHIVLIGVVLICMLARYVVLLGDEATIQSKPATVSGKDRKTNNRVLKLQFAPNGSMMQNSNFFKLRRAGFSAENSNPNYLMVKDVQ